MNLSSLGATVAAHKVPLMVAGGGVVVALGLRARSKASTAAPAGATLAGYAPAPTGSAGAYDSSSNDVYNAIQPQLEQTQGMLGQLLDRLGPGGTIPTAPKPTTTPKPAPKPKPKTPPRTHPTPAPRRKSPTPPVRYVVRKGDSLSAIGKRYGITWQQLYAANKAAVGRNPNVIHPGLSLTIPR